VADFDPEGPIPIPEEGSRRRHGGHGAPGIANPSRKLRGPNGRPLCRVCAQEVPPRRRTFCSGGNVTIVRENRTETLGFPKMDRARRGTVEEEWGCVEEWRVRSDSGFARAAVFHRDRGVCLRCGLDTIALRARMELVLSCLRGGDGAAFREKLKDFDPFLGSHGELWNVDHAIPVSEGGGQCGLDNLRTLCIPCHRIETAALARKKRR
jgi:5-methylcytosine-specific restriction endonuclease McrA